MTAVRSRHVIHAEAISWLAANRAPLRSSVITSLPDLSELPDLGELEWRAWFIDAARAILRWIPEDGVAVFFQSDIRRAGRWIDKGYLILRAAEEERAELVWHKIVCRRPAGTIALGRPSYSHMLCLSRTARQPALRPGPDVLPDAGFMPWSRAMGAKACAVACRFLRDETTTEVVVDPFCGRGTVLAVANALDFDAIGVDLGAKRCRAARSLVIDEGDL